MAARRFLPLVFAAIAAGPIAGCVTFATSGSLPHPDPPLEPVEPSGSTEFASFPKRPGEVALKNPELTASKPPVAEPTEPTEPTEPIAVPVADPNVIHASVPPSTPAVAIPSASEPALLAALRAYIENRPEDAIRHLSTLDRASQDHALTLLPVLVRSSQMNQGTANPEEAAVIVDQLRALTARLETQAALKVEKVAFCRKISGFGRYEPWAEGQPYKPNDLAMLYVELRNVGSEPASGPGGESYLSRAVVSLEVRDANGKLVEQTDPSDWRRRVPIARFEQVDHTHSPLHDYSRTYRISVPTQPGVYTVTVVVKDSTGRRAARSQPAEFRVAGP
jgi:hypothetical protein